jgi:hypothetical protein
MLQPVGTLMDPFCGSGRVGHVQDHANGAWAIATGHGTYDRLFCIDAPGLRRQLIEHQSGVDFIRGFLP